MALLTVVAPTTVQQGWQGLRDPVTPPPGALHMPNTIYPSPPTVPAPAPHAGRLTGRVTHVRDGDTIVVEQTPIRFEGIDCAEKGTAKGDRATKALREIAAGQTVQCRLAGRLSYDRQIGSCTLANGQDLGMTLVARKLCVLRR